MEVPDPLKMAWLDTSDWGNAKRLVTIAGGKLLWIEDKEAWAHFDGQRWSLERGDSAAWRIAHQVIEHIDVEVEALAELADDAVQLKRRVGEWCSKEIAEERVKALRGHAVKSGSAGATRGMLIQARSLLSVMGEDFDIDPLAYNLTNGTLRFVQQEDGKWAVRFLPHDPADRLMQMAGVAYEPGAACPFWEERLVVLHKDPEQLAALQALYGYTLTGLTSDQAFYVHQGKGGDGKSATHQALAELHGDYYRHAGVRTFLQGSGQRGGAEHRSDLVRLAGDVRFVTCDEPPPRSVWDGEVIKQITGSLVTARGSGARTEITYRPRFKLHPECNVTPRAPSDDKGFRRRFKLYQWRVSLTETAEGEMPIDAVLDRLRGERSGILNWMITGALEWLATRRIPQPKAMEAVLSEFWADSSPLLEWMGEWCDCADPDARTLSKDLYAHFKTWCEDAGMEQIMSAKAFGVALREKQFASWKDPKGQRWRKGLRLRTEGMFEGPGAAASMPSGPPPRAAGSLGSHARRPAVEDDRDDY
jgi:putative DNA primase/helicase